MPFTDIDNLLENMTGVPKTKEEILAMIHTLATELSEHYKQEAENPKLEGFVKALQWVLGKEIYKEKYTTIPMPGGLIK